MKIINSDCISYYPNLMLKNNLYPAHLPNFLKEFKRIVDTRIHAKKIGDKVTADTYKICINSGFGRMGNKYSTTYAPKSMIDVTITGQLSLLMLIEQLAEYNINVVSANTDGIVSLVPDDLEEMFYNVCCSWEIETGQILEHDYWKQLHIKDCNNYVAITVDGKLKEKGIFASDSLSKNPQGQIIYWAVKEYLLNQTPVTDTIKNCTDVTEFLLMRKVTGGAKWGDTHLGKVVRWYWSKGGSDIRYVKTGNKVPNSDSSTPMMQLINLPKNIDYERYINAAFDVLTDLGLGL